MEAGTLASDFKSPEPTRNGYAARAKHEESWVARSLVATRPAQTNVVSLDDHAFNGSFNANSQRGALEKSWHWVLAIVLHSRQAMAVASWLQIKTNSMILGVCVDS